MASDASAAARLTPPSSTPGTSPRGCASTGGTGRGARRPSTCHGWARAQDGGNNRGTRDARAGSGGSLARPPGVRCGWNPSAALGKSKIVRPTFRIRARGGQGGVKGVVRLAREAGSAAQVGMLGAAELPGRLALNGRRVALLAAANRLATVGADLDAAVGHGRADDAELAADGAAPGATVSRVPARDGLPVVLASGVDALVHDPPPWRSPAHGGTVCGAATTTQKVMRAPAARVKATRAPARIEVK